jgi:hypothetical protein
MNEVPESVGERWRIDWIFWANVDRDIDMPLPHGDHAPSPEADRTPGNLAGANAEELSHGPLPAPRPIIRTAVPPFEIKALPAAP